MTAIADERQQVLAALEAGLSEILASHGFERRPDSVSSGEVFRRWERASSWRVDRFEMVSHEADFSGPELQMRVDIPLPEGGSAFVDSSSVPWAIAGRSGRLISYATVESQRTAAAKHAVVRKALDDCAKALTWLDGFSTPEKCLEQLARRDRNGVRVGTPRHTAAIEVVKSARQ